MPTVYKVVRRLRNGKLVSAMIYGRFRLEYVPGKATYPEVGQCLAFRLRRDAEWFAWREGLEVWRATATRTRLIFRLAKLSMGLFRRFWVRETLTGWPTTFTAAEGTVACPDITLEKKVWPKGDR